MNEPAVVGIDLGGTNVRLALVSPQGKILSRWERATASMPDQAALVAALAADLTQAGEAARESGWEIKGGGIGVPGRVLPREGRVVFSPNVAALNDCRLVDHLSLLVNWPLFLENDANLFALGEHWLGAGVGHDHMLGITLGTGVGGGLILNGRLWTGAEGTSGEIGHMTVDPEGRKCHCGNRGCLETMASAFWTVAWVKEQLAQQASSWLRELYAADPEAIQGRNPGGGGIARPILWPGGPLTGWGAAWGRPLPRWCTFWGSPGWSSGAALPGPGRCFKLPCRRNCTGASPCFPRRR